MKTNVYKNNKDYIKWLSIKVGIVLLVIALDLVTKYIFEARYEDGLGNITLINGVLSFTYTQNTGAAFSLFSDSTIFITIMSVLFIIGLFIADYYGGSKNAWYYLGFGFIIGGGLGNFIDRVFLGYVRDFIRFDFITFPIFNIADTFLTIGIICYGIYILFYYGNTKQVS